MSEKTLEAMSEFRVQLFKEYSPDCGLSFNEWLIEKLLDARKDIELLERLRMRVAEYYALFEYDDKKREKRQEIMKQQILAIVLEGLK